MIGEKKARAIGLMLVFAVGGCMPPDDSLDGAPEGTDLEFRGDDGGTPTRPPGGGTWAGNGLLDPLVDWIDPSVGLASQVGLLTDPDLRDTAEYLVECALAPSQSIDDELDGLLGFAPEWEDDACDSECRQWVTACLLARTNITGQEILVGLRADHEEVGTMPFSGFPYFEASWYGDMFASTPVLYFCQGNPGGSLAAETQGRTCSTGDAEDCGFTDLGSCYDPGRCATSTGAAIECAAGGQTYKTLSTYMSSQ